MKFKQSNDHLMLKTKLMFTDKHKLMGLLLNRYVTMTRSTTAETALAEYVFDDIEAQSLTILSVCVMSGKRSPVASLLGVIASALLKKNLDSGKVMATYHCVAEFMYSAPEIFIRSTAFFGGEKIQSIFYDESEAEKKLFQLPSIGNPTKQHKALGRFKWEITNTEAIDKLNNVPMTVLDFEEQAVPPEGTEDRVKHDIRAALRPHLAKENTKLFFNWNSDYRGRMYASGYHFNTQGDEYEKNIMVFHEPYKYTNRDEYQEAEYQIQLAIAVAFGKDKLTDEEKMEWFAKEDESNLANLDWTKAKEPTYARAQLASLRMLRATDSTNIPIELDATCSQRQIVSVLTGSLKTAMTCNVITDNSHIQDAYGLVAKEMSAISGLKFDRTQIKQSDMISGYGAGRKKVIETLKEDLKDYYFDGVADIFYKASDIVDPMASKIKDIFQGLWDDSRTHWTWTLPDGFKVQMYTEEARQITVNPFGFGEISVIAHMIMPTSKNTALGVNVIHSVDAYICRQMVVRCPFDIITIHDGYRCLPHHAPEMKRIYNEILAEITDSTLLEDIIEELVGIRIELKKEFQGHHVMHSEYSLS